MSVASTLRGLTQIDLSTLAPPDPTDPFAAAYPTFKTFTPAGATTPRDEVVLLRKSVATAPTARQLGAMAGGLAAFDENDVPGVLRALNPANDATERGFPTFTYGQSQNRRFMNVVRLKRGFRLDVAPDATPGFADLTAVEAVFAGAHDFARSRGFASGFPTFNRVPVPPTTVLGNEVVVFPAGSPGVLVNGDLAAGSQPPSWRFESLPALNEGGLALVAGPATNALPLLFNVFDGKLFQYRHSPPSSLLVDVDPDVAGTRHAPGPIESMVSAAADADMVHALYADGALFHATRPSGLPDSFTFFTASGRTSPGPAGLVGMFNHLTLAPDGSLHAFAYLSYPPETTPPPTEAAGYNLLHLSFDGTSWTEETVDGEATTLGHVVGDAGQMMSAAFEPDGTLHAFYLLVVGQDDAVGGFTRRLRHAQLGAGGWIAETLDGSGAATAPPSPGTGPTRADVGASPTAVWFDGALWCVYEDRTWGNLRCARGRRDAGGTLRWDFHVVDGNAGFRRTRGVVQAAVAVVWDDTLSVFYCDQTRQVMRHAYRRTGAARWSYEVIDGDGGPDGRVDAPTVPLIAAAAGGRTADGNPTRPVFVAYRWESPQTPASSSLRLATLD